MYSILAQKITKKFKTTTALDQLTLSFEPSLMHGLIGPEGAGKTTFLRLIVQLLKPTEGVIQFTSNQIPITFEMIKHHVAYMPQQQSLYADLSIEEHLRFFSDLYHLSKKEYLEKSEKLLYLTRLDKFKDRPAGKLSGGMYKKLGLICSLLRSPAILLLDEPTNGVDPISRREFWELLYGLRKEKILIVVTTAYMDEAERCDKAHLLQEGHLIDSGSPEELFKRNGVKSIQELFLQKTRS